MSQFGCVWEIVHRLTKLVIEQSNIGTKKRLKPNKEKQV
jgi:hypothetical protein